MLDKAGRRRGSGSLCRSGRATAVLRPAAERIEAQRSGENLQPPGPAIHTALPPQDEQQVVDKVNHDQLRELDSFLENQTIQKNYLRNLQNEATEFCTSSDTVLRDISFWDTVPLDESHLSSRPSSVEEEDTEEERTKSSICNNISSTVLNLKVSQLLLQQVESSLDKFESRMMGNTCSDIPQFDEPDGRRDRQVVMLKAAGPPSYNYIPSVMRQEMEEVTEFCSAGEESFESSEADKNISQRDRRTRGGQEQAVRFTEECDGLYQSSAACTSQELTQTQRAEHNWTSEVSTAVAWMTRGFLSCAAGALVESSDSEEEQPQCPLMDAEEALFKSFAVVHSESEDSTDFHTMNHTFTLPNAVYEIKGQHREEDGSDSDYAQSPLELSSIFYTPKHNPDNTHAKEELSQKPNSEDDPDVTMEVCRPDMTVQTTFRECRSSPEEPEHTETESAPPSVHTTRSSHMADIADLSSITCSPAQLQEWVGQNEARTSPHSTHFPPCNSTPRSPHTHTAGRGRSAPHREAVCVSPLVPHLQSLMETSPWGSAESPSHTESYNMARLECTDTVHWSVPESFPQGDSDTPSSCNLEFTTVSSGVRHSEEKKSQDHGDTAALECDTEKDGSLEEAKRAHSTLDEVLQGLMENTEAQRTMRGAAVITDVSAGSDQEEERVFGQSVSAERGICRQLEEEEILEEDYSCSRGDAGEGVATRGTKKKTLSSKVSGSDMEKLV